MIVSQDCGHKDTQAVIESYGDQIIYIQQPGCFLKGECHKVQLPPSRPVRACHSSEGEEVQRLLQDRAPLWLGAQQDICRDGL